MSRDEFLIDVPALPEAVRAGAQLLDVRWTLGEPPGAGRLAFVEGHLAGARFADLEELFTGPLADPEAGRHPLPDASRLADGLAALGLDVTRPAVVYDIPGSFAAGRAWWVLRWAGLEVRVLDGGLPAWVAAGGELVAGDEPASEHRDVGLNPGRMPTIGADELAGFAGTLVDVRVPERYRGEVEPIDPRAGHIPGAVNRPVTGFWDADGRLPADDVLRERLALPAGPVAVYCGSGVSAAQVLLACAVLGVDATLYPAGWSGWSADPSHAASVGDQP